VRVCRLPPRTPAGAAKGLGLPGAPVVGMASCRDGETLSRSERAARAISACERLVRWMLWCCPVDRLGAPATNRLSPFPEFGRHAAGGGIATLLHDGLATRKRHHRCTVQSQCACEHPLQPMGGFTGGRVERSTESGQWAHRGRSARPDAGKTLGSLLSARCAAAGEVWAIGPIDPVLVGSLDRSRGWWQARRLVRDGLPPDLQTRT
jgi:hypothetical protein